MLIKVSVYHEWYALKNDNLITFYNELGRSKNVDIRQNNFLVRFWIANGTGNKKRQALRCDLLPKHK